MEKEDVIGFVRSSLQSLYSSLLNKLLDKKGRINFKLTAPKKEKAPVDIIVAIKQAMSPIFDKKFNPKSVVDRIESKKDIDDINKEITIIQKKVKDVSSKLKPTGKQTESETSQLQKLQQKYTNRLKSIVKNIKLGASTL